MKKRVRLFACMIFVAVTTMCVVSWAEMRFAEKRPIAAMDGGPLFSVFDSLPSSISGLRCENRFSNNSQQFFSRVSFNPSIGITEDPPCGMHHVTIVASENCVDPCGGQENTEVNPDETSCYRPISPEGCGCHHYETCDCPPLSEG